MGRRLIITTTPTPTRPTRRSMLTIPTPNIRSTTPRKATGSGENMEDRRIAPIIVSSHHGINDDLIRNSLQIHEVKGGGLLRIVDDIFSFFRAFGGRGRMKGKKRKRLLYGARSFRSAPKRTWWLLVKPHRKKEGFARAKEEEEHLWSFAHGLVLLL